MLQYLHEIKQHNHYPHRQSNISETQSKNEAI